MVILIQNGYLLNPADGREGLYDILIENGMIQEIGKQLNQAADHKIDAAGCYVMPGFIDMHVHLREPGFEYKETIATGTRAAAAGGYTTVCPMPNTKPVIDSAEWIHYLKEKEQKEAAVHLVPVGAVTKGQEGKELADLAGMAAAGALAVSEDGKSVMDICLYREAMKAAAKAGLLVMAHCEDKSLAGNGVMNAGAKAEELKLSGISNSVEDVITARDILLAKETGVRLHLCHCSTAASVEMVKLAKEKGISVTAEVCPHHFVLSDEEIPGDIGNYKMNPPLRSLADVEALKEGLKNGIMDVISTDHAPHSAEEKERSMKLAPFGIVGSETAFSLSWTHLVKTGFLTPMQLVEKMSWRPAQILGLDKGNLAPGKSADLVIADPEAEVVIDAAAFYSKGKNTPFHGCKVFGRVVYTFVDGTAVYEKGQIV